MDDAGKDKCLTRLLTSGIDHQVGETVQIDVRYCDAFPEPANSRPGEGEVVRLRCGIGKHVNQAGTIGSNHQLISGIPIDVSDRNRAAVNSPSKVRSLA